MRATNLMYRCPKEQTPDPYYFTTLNDGRSIDYSRKDNLQKSFSQAPRFILYKQMAQRTGSNVGPGSYLVQEALSKLRNKPCMAKLSQTYLADEDCYEIVNNMRVLQPKYIKEKQKRVFDRSLEAYQRSRELRRINETLVHQRSILELDKLSSTKPAKFTNVNSTQKSRNRLFEDGSASLTNNTVDFHLMDRPRTQHALTRKRRTIENGQLSNFGTIGGENRFQHTLTGVVGGFDENLNQEGLQLKLEDSENLKQMEVQSMGNVGKIRKGKSKHNQTHSLIEKATILNGSTQASFDQYATQTNLRGADAGIGGYGGQGSTTYFSGLTSLKARSKQSSELGGMRIRNKSQNNTSQQKERLNAAYSLTQVKLGGKKGVDKNKKYIKQIINNNCYIDQSNNVNNIRINSNGTKSIVGASNRAAQEQLNGDDMYLKQPSFDGGDANHSTSQSK